MAIDWRSNLKKLQSTVTGVVDAVIRAAPPNPNQQTQNAAGGKENPATPPAPEPRKWYDWMLDSIPYCMLFTGILLAGICVNFEKTVIWAFFGFMLIAVSPVVYWLQRLDRRMTEWMNLQRRWRD